MAWNVVIAGGGFGGLYAARRLERKLPCPPTAQHPLRQSRVVADDVVGALAEVG